LPLEVAQVGTLHAVRAMQRGVSRQDAFLILKLATYSSGFAGSNGFPITENDLYDVAGGVIDFGNEARAGGVTDFAEDFLQTAAWVVPQRALQEIAQHLRGCLRSDASR
jgi:hypothetical protein